MNDEVLWVYTLIFLYALTMLFSFFYSIGQVYLLTAYCFKRKKIDPLPLSETPMVTIQLPIFNEMYVSARLIDAVIGIAYPKERLQIQVLDDSTDETMAIIAEKVAIYQAEGYDIQQRKRSNRKGFKAGALHDAMPEVKGEFIAIFDADFLPQNDFLEKTLPYLLQNEQLAVVQTRWQHLNQTYSLLTRLQALQLNVHFSIEQSGRQNANLILQFNGTAGVWRKKAIEEAGGWHFDTLTEDLDLSIRTQMKGRKILFLEKIGVDAELPAEMNGLKNQQFRWMKGGAENAKKLLKAIWGSENLSFMKKLLATQHLLSSSLSSFILLSGFASWLLLFWLKNVATNIPFLALTSINFFIILTLCFVANLQPHIRKEKRFLVAFLELLVLFPIFLCMAMGLSVHNSAAVMEGFSGKKSEFVRTPKYGLRTFSDTFHKHAYLSLRPSKSTLLEGFLSLFFAFGVVYGLKNGVYDFVILHGLLAIGFGSVFGYSIYHLKRDLRF